MRLQFANGLLELVHGDLCHEPGSALVTSVYAGRDLHRTSAPASVVRAGTLASNERLASEPATTAGRPATAMWLAGSAMRALRAQANAATLETLLVLLRAPLVPGRVELTTWQRPGESARAWLHVPLLGWLGGEQDEFATLAAGLRSSLELIAQHRWERITWSLLGTGDGRLPLDLATAMLVRSLVEGLEGSLLARTPPTTFCLVAPDPGTYGAVARCVEEFISP